MTEKNKSSDQSSSTTLTLPSYQEITSWNEEQYSQFQQSFNEGMQQVQQAFQQIHSGMTS